METWGFFYYHLICACAFEGLRPRLQLAGNPFSSWGIAMTDNCKSCRFFKRPPLITNDEGRCHRLPPSVHMVSTPRGVIEMSAFAATKNSNWCGEWQGAAEKPRNDCTHMGTDDCEECAQ